MRDLKSSSTINLRIFYSYACRDTYLLFRLLREVQEQGQAVNIVWSPFAIQMDGDPDYWIRPWEQARSELRGFIAASAARQQGKKAFLAFHAALEVAVHEQLLELGDERTLLDTASLAGLDMDFFASAFRDPELARSVYESHQQAAQQYGIFGTPTIVFSNNQAIHLELVEDIPARRSLSLFRDIVDLGNVHPYLSKLERVTALGA